jgi:phosphate acyltransferase
MAELVTVAVDANGADLGPAEVARGAALAAANGTRVLLFGPAAEMEEADGVEIVDAPVSIAKASEPAKAARSQPEASIVQAARSVAEGRAGALVSGGSTGAALAAGLFEIKRARGVHRPALTLTIPVPGRPVLLIDVGANTEARPEHLVQFAYMGAAFAQGVLGIDAPRVGLLSNGEEATRGSAVVIDAHERLTGATGLEFVGNVEGTTLVEGVADVVVTDGFTGNVAVKLMEGTTTALLNAIREAATSSSRGKAGGLLLRPALSELRDAFDVDEVGNAYLLGLRSLGIICHGRLTQRGFQRAIEVAERGVRERVVDRTYDALSAAGALRAVSEPAATVTPDQ